jgi:hypothetical protein
MDIFPLGTIPLDPHVPKAVKEQEPLITRYPASDAAKGVKNLARYLISKGSTELNNFELRDFWQRCLERLSGNLVLTNIKSQTPQRTAPEELTIEQKKRLREGEKEPEINGPKAAPVSEAAPEKAPEKETERASDSPVDKVTEIVPDIVIEKPSERPDQLETKVLLTILEKLVKGMSSISYELGAIRRLMEDDRKRAAGR